MRWIRWAVGVTAFGIAAPLLAGSFCCDSLDSSTAPALPSGWSAVTGATCASTAAWANQTSTVHTPPNAAATNDPNCVSDESLVSPSVFVASSKAQLTFFHRFNLENTFDGGVVEISVDGGSFGDIIAAGGAFVAGTVGYNGTISLNFSSPIAGRQAFTGNSGTFVKTSIVLPPSTVGHLVAFRWRRGSDTSVASVGWQVDSVQLSNLVIHGILGSGSPDWPSVSLFQTGRIYRDGFSSTCAETKSCSIFDATPGRAVDVYSIENRTGSTACVAATLQLLDVGTCPLLHLVAYLQSYDPVAVCQNYLADIGTSSTGDARTMNFLLGANATTAVVVSAVNSSVAGCRYVLAIGGTCPLFDDDLEWSNLDAWSTSVP